MAPKQKREDTGELQVSIEQYTKTRDSVIVALSNLQGGLTHVQNGINDLLRAYMQHTSSILAGEDGDLEKLQIPSSIAAVAANAMDAAAVASNGLGQVIANQAAPTTTTTTAAAAAGADANKGKKRKREKKPRDPDAPKKPLTAAFLYTHNARSIVKRDLELALEQGATIEKNAVQIEVNKRWNELPEDEKEQWKASYRASMEQYKIDMAEYIAKKGGNAAAIHDDVEASDEGEGEIEAEAGAIDSDDSDDDEEPVAKAPSPPAKTPRKRQKIAAAPTTNGTSNTNNTPVPIPIAPATTSTPIPLPPTSRPAVVIPPPPAPVAEIPAKKEKKKRAAPQPIAPAPSSPVPEVAVEEPGKKKVKSGRSTRGAEAEIDKENAAAAAAPKEKKRDRSKRKSEVGGA